MSEPSSPAAFRCTHYQEAGLEVEEPGLEPGTLVQEMGVPSSDVTTVTNACSFKGFLFSLECFCIHASPVPLNDGETCPVLGRVCPANVAYGS